MRYHMSVICTTITLILLCPATSSGNTITIHDRMSSGAVHDFGTMTTHAEPDWATPGILIPPQTQGGFIHRGEFAIAAAIRGDDSSRPSYGGMEMLQAYEFEFHLWTGGFDGTGHSFSGSPKRGDIVIKQSDEPGQLYIDPIPFRHGSGHAGPLFRLVVEPDDILLDQDTEYVMAVIAKSRLDPDPWPGEWVSLLWSFGFDGGRDVLAASVDGVGDFSPAFSKEYTGTGIFASKLILRVPEPGLLAMVLGSALILSASTRGVPDERALG